MRVASSSLGYSLDPDSDAHLQPLHLQPVIPSPHTLNRCKTSPVFLSRPRLFCGMRNHGPGRSRAGVLCLMANLESAGRTTPRVWNTVHQPPTQARNALRILARRWGGGSIVRDPQWKRILPLRRAYRTTHTPVVAVNNQASINRARASTEQVIDDDNDRGLPNLELLQRSPIPWRLGLASLQRYITRSPARGPGQTSASTVSNKQPNNAQITELDVHSKTQAQAGQRIRSLAANGSPARLAPFLTRFAPLKLPQLPTYHTVQEASERASVCGSGPAKQAPLLRMSILQPVRPTVLGVRGIPLSHTGRRTRVKVKRPARAGAVQYSTEKMTCLAIDAGAAVPIN
ncbi:hypothetical protein CALCODRAFT_527458 [Calocera cornea HHB12733]|uniref:Uncharacterized protein n=1 Tax=Calocera cornea HHB12733 TaxID=1353952 RepID=A0A165J2X4_9BASI|nr:hypothetical protein CALCODRAFT_527458 [Calocera cornea HHB12733]